MFLPGLIPALQNRSSSLFWILLTGLGFRLALMLPEPILEIDFARYLWDGAVTAAGHSPYVWSPAEVTAGAAPGELQDLARGSGGLVAEINYPRLTTIYPPAAQVVFALSSLIEPFDITVWRLVLLVFEVATAALLYRLLLALGRSPLWIAIYWLNPIVIFEFANGAHMDALLLPFLVAAVLLAARGRNPAYAAACLAIATAVKLWPALLLPAFLRPFVARPRTALVAIVAFSAITAILLWPLVAEAYRGDAGVQAYGLSWERNAALFHAGLGVLRAVLDDLGFFNVDAGRILRTLSLFAVFSIALLVNRRAPANAEDLIRRILIVIAAMLLLGPAMLPWYYTWMVPFLAVIPNRALLAFSVVLPLYRLQFHPWFLDQAWVFTDLVVWLEQGPILALLILEWHRRRKTKPAL